MGVGAGRCRRIVAGVALGRAAWAGDPPRVRRERPAGRRLSPRPVAGAVRSRTLVILYSAHYLP